MSPVQIHHVIASIYHWGENEIWDLSIPRTREILNQIDKENRAILGEDVDPDGILEGRITRYI